MAENTDTQFLENLQAALANIDPGDGALKGLFEFFAESERYLRFNHPDLENPKTALLDPDEGSREFGLVLFLLDNPTPAIKEWIEGDAIIKTVWDVLKRAQKESDLATTNLTPPEHNLLIATPYISGDGTIYGIATYEQLDFHPGWLISALNYVINLLIPPAVHCFNTAPFAGTLKTSSKDGPLIAILGDWGTGNYKTSPAQQIMNEARNHNPDYIIHLGDVYYAGTDKRPGQHEEQQNFLDLWDGNHTETAFTLNSNHEMYGNGSKDFGGSGIVDVALGKGTPFAHQNQTTYFALDFDPWVILGLDSAYYSPAAGALMYMNGAIGDDDNHEQANWIASLNIGADKKIIVMTHHNPIHYTGGPNKSKLLQNQVKSALGRMPDYWYWGHIHLGASYKSNAACAPTLGRCVGHSAIPFGRPWGLEGSEKCDYFSQTINLNIPGSFRALNGYMTIQLNANGTITEKWYELGGTNPVWPK